MAGRHVPSCDLAITSLPPTAIVSESHALSLSEGSGSNDSQKHPGQHPQPKLTALLHKSDAEASVEDNNGISNKLQCLTAQEIEELLTTHPALAATIHPRQGELLVLNHYLTKSVAKMYQKQKSRYFQITGRAEDTMSTTADIIAINAPRLNKKFKSICKQSFAKLLDRQLGVSATTPMSTSDILDNLPAYLDAHPDFKPYIVNDPLTPYLNGNHGLKYCPADGKVFKAGSIIAMYQGKVYLDSKFEAMLNSTATSFERKLEVDSYACSIKCVNNHTVNSPPHALLVSAFGHGNVSALINDPHINPLDYTKPDLVAPANCRLVEVQLGYWTFACMFAGMDIHPGSVVLYDYGASYWNIFKEKRLNIELNKQCMEEKDAEIAELRLQVASLQQQIAEQQQQDQAATADSTGIPTTMVATEEEEDGQEDEEEEEEDSAAKRKLREYNKLLQLAATNIEGHREDGPPLGLEFDDTSIAGEKKKKNRKSNKRKKMCYRRTVGAADDDYVAGGSGVKRPEKKMKKEGAAGGRKVVKQEKAKAKIIVEPHYDFDFTLDDD